MNDELFESLLYEEEGPTLDFKQEQYLFSKASDTEKSELLKDILGFANAWRRSDAYILIGVEDHRGEPCKVLGITDHLEDHSLQQFINSRTNTPVRFHYEAFNYDGKKIGVIRIEDQNRPIYLKADFGKLKRNEVYVRRGSSTDPTKPATPDEIAQMGRKSAEGTAELVAEFSDTQHDKSLGPEISWEAEYCKFPSAKDIQDMDEQRENAPATFFSSGLSIGQQLSSDFYEDLSSYIFAGKLYRQVRIVVQNVGKIVSKDVRVELILQRSGACPLRCRIELPEQPLWHYDMLANIRPLQEIQESLRDFPGKVTIDKNDERYRVDIDFGSLQPGRKVWSEPFWIGVEKTGLVPIPGLIFADNLPEPKNFELRISAVVNNPEISSNDLIGIGKKIRGR